MLDDYLGGVKTGEKIKNLNFTGRKIVASESRSILPPLPMLLARLRLLDGQRACTSEKKGEVRDSVEKSHGKRPPVRPRRRWEDI